MSESNLPRGTKMDGVFLTEAPALLNQQVLGPVSWEATGQNQDLRYVKAGLAKAARDLGANAIVNFEYGQKAKLGFFEGFRDNEKWFGKGVAVKVAPALVEDVPNRESTGLTWKGW